MRGLPKSRHRPIMHWRFDAIALAFPQTREREQSTVKPAEMVGLFVLSAGHRPLKKAIPRDQATTGLERGSKGRFRRNSLGTRVDQ